MMYGFIGFFLLVLYLDNIDTRTALMVIKDLVAQTNAYIEKRRSDQSFNRGLLKNVAQYVTEIFDILGLIPAPEQIGFGSASGGVGGGEANVSVVGPVSEDVM